MVEEGIESIPEKFRAEISNVQIVVCDEPSPEQIKKLNLTPGSLLFGLYEGVPQTKRGIGYSGVLPDKITIFQKSMEQVAGESEEKIKQIVKDTVFHEIAHHFGTDEERIRQIEIKKGRNI